MEYLQYRKEKTAGYDFKSIISHPDPRFKKLALFYSEKYKQSFPKGQMLHGMSGGPIISLEREGEPKLAALTNFIVPPQDMKDIQLNEEAKNENPSSLNGAVAAEEIREFVKNYEAYKPYTPPENLKPSDTEY